MYKKYIAIIFLCISSLLYTACLGNDTYKLARKMYEYKQNDKGYKDTLKMARDGNYDANCTDCFKGFDTQKISLFAYACEVDLDFAMAIYDNGADIEVSNPQYPRTPLLAAVNGNRDDVEIVYWLIDQGADIDAIDFNDCCIFHYLRYWKDNEATNELIDYLKSNCDMKYLEKNTDNNPFCSWDDMWDEDDNFIFYKK